MIMLEKGEKPTVLAANEATWTRTLLDKLERGEKPTDVERTRYRHPEIKEALRQETCGKCAYCESKILHVAFGDVEHIVPKSKKPELTFIWANLTLACDRCNIAKGDREGTLNPYEDNPADHLEFVGCLVIHRPGSTLGASTERLLDLNRLELIERRAERLKRLVALRDLLHAERDPARRAVLDEDIRSNEATSHQEYAALSRWFISGHLTPFDLWSRSKIS